MIDFTNKNIIKLKEISTRDGEKIIEKLLIPGEVVVFAFSSMRDKLIFTNKRIVAVNVQGITGSKIDYTSIPYSKIQTFSIETAGTFDLDAELDISLSPLGTIRFELSAQTNMRELGQHLSMCIL